jgi:hypothetical protein
MAAWVITVPVGTEEANTLHTLIQNVKIDIMERMKVTDSDGTVEHLVKDPNATGRHPLSKVDFTCLYANLAVFIASRTDPFARDSTLHFTIDTNKLYVGRKQKPGSTNLLDYIELVATTDHGEYSGLEEDKHTRLLLKDGTRVMETDLTIDTGGTLTVETIDVADDQPIDAVHVTQSWFEAHGADAIDGSFFKDDTFTGLFVAEANNTSNGTDSDFCISALSTPYAGGIFVTSYTAQSTSNYYSIRSVGLSLGNYIYMPFAFKRDSLQLTSRSV